MSHKSWLDFEKEMYVIKIGGVSLLYHGDLEGPRSPHGGHK